GAKGLFMPGLVPPDAGSAWHIAHELPLKPGPRPLPSSALPLASTTPSPMTESTSSKAAFEPSNSACSCSVSPASAAPAPMVPPRGPGSVALMVGVCATPMQLEPLPVKLATRLPLMFDRLTTVGLNVQPDRFGWTENDAVASGMLIENEYVPALPVVWVCIKRPASWTVTPF